VIIFSLPRFFSFTPLLFFFTGAVVLMSHTQLRNRERRLSPLGWVFALAIQLFSSVVLLEPQLLRASCSDSRSLEAVVGPLIEEFDGHVGLAIRHLPSGQEFFHNSEAPMPTASLIKLPVLAAVHESIAVGRLSLDQMIVMEESEMVPGSGILTSHFSAGLQLPLRDVLRLMIVYSDNTATNLAVEQIGISRTAEYMQELGFPNTKLHAKVYRGETSVFPERSKQFGLGSTTAREMIQLLQLLHEGKLVNSEASRQMLDLLYACDDKTMLVRDLPASVKVAHKSGAVSKSRTDAGLIDSPSGTIAVCVLTTENADQSWSDDNRAHQFIGRIALAAYDYFNPPSPLPLQHMRLAVGSVGPWVQTLQRTLNQRLEPSPDLTTDGDFGPMTQRAVIAFQSSLGLPETGTVDSATWKALGSLITADMPVPDPEVINANTTKRNPLPPLDGPPAVTCKAWAIGDANTGELLWGHDEDQALHPASTTKIMTAYTILSLAERDPGVLDEIVTFSEQAADTIGSSSGLEAGEQVPVGELLYGLLLPSGNDASVALAEHFAGRGLMVANEEHDEEHSDSPSGGSVTENDSAQKQPSAASNDNLQAFVDSMNAKARELGLSRTVYMNPHGLTDDRHLSSARDLLVLSSRALQQPEFRLRVSTKQRGCRVSSISGYERNVVWTNTNRFLDTEGFQGVKTGTTKAAGACLVAHAEHEDRQWIVVVLGAASTESRYADAMNLFRWAWEKEKSAP
jgi:D-alanyl-D-alanine carboxypeptidase (penicillin-binding protein 5/6)